MQKKKNIVGNKKRSTCFGVKLAGRVDGFVCKQIEMTLWECGVQSSFLFYHRNVTSFKRRSSKATLNVGFKTSLGRLRNMYTHF